VKNHGPFNTLKSMLVICASFFLVTGYAWNFDSRDQQKWANLPGQFRQEKMGKNGDLCTSSRALHHSSYGKPAYASHSCKAVFKEEKNLINTNFKPHSCTTPSSSLSCSSFSSSSASVTPDLCLLVCVFGLCRAPAFLFFYGERVK